MSPHVHTHAASSTLPDRMRRRLDAWLLLLLVIMVAGRCLIHEAFPLKIQLAGPMPGPRIASGETTAMIVFAAMIFTALAVWLLVRIRSGLLWRKTALAGPLLLFMVAGIISTLAASDKHRAVVGAANIISQMAAAVLLMQLLDAPWKRRLLACAIIAAGVTQAYRCWEQHHYDFDEAIRNYQADPQRALAAQNIEPGTYAAEQFEERLYSRDVGGFFAISNTAAAFFILTLSMTLAAIGKRWGKNNAAPLLLAAGLLAVQLLGLALTQSKGGIAAFAAAILLILMLWTGRHFFARHGKAIFIGAILLMALGGGAIIFYGASHDRLPSNSMWVRWQYWTASAEMIRDHGLTGVGAENFGRYYPRYMDPAAPEVVSDPHCFPLAIWTQWGVLGFIAMLWAIAAVAWRATPQRVVGILPTKHDGATPPVSGSQERGQDALATNKPPWGWWPWIIALTIGIFIIRRAVSDLSPISNSTERQSVMVISFIVPAFIWLIAFWAALAATKNSAPTNGSVLILGGGLLGFLLHNSIDFAIFQPGVGLLLMAATALLLSYRQGAVTVTRRKATLMSLAAAAALGVYLYYGIPIARSQSWLNKAQRAALSGQLPLAQTLAQKASGADAAHMQTELAMMRWASSSRQLPADITELQTHYFPMWAAADSENFKVYLTIGEFYRQAAQKFPDHEKFRDLAIDYYRQALQRHPHKSEILIAYAELLMDAGQNDPAAAALEKALAAEEAFLAQQRRMYPDRAPLRPRLQPALREHAQTLLNTLSPPHKN